MSNQSARNPHAHAGRRGLRRLAARAASGRPTARFRPLVEPVEDRRLLALVINPTFDSTITSDANAATIEATINRTIAAFESFISDNITVNITFREGGGLGGSSGGLLYFENYQDYYNALVSHKTSANDTTAIASLPNQSTDPVNGQTTIAVRAPLARALGFNAPTPNGDGTITLNTAICNLDRTSPQDPSKYDLQAVVAHEIDEILASGSALDSLANTSATPTGRVSPLDLFRYSAANTRSFTTSATATSYFSIDGGTTNLVGFNQYSPSTTSPNDFGDWFSNNGRGATTPRVQDSNSTPGATPNMNVELTRLDILGFTLAPLHAPVVTAASDQTAVEGTAKAFNLGSFTDPDAAPWGVTVDWGDGSSTKYSLNSAGSLGTRTHAYAEEGSYTVKVTVNDFTSQSQSQTYQVTVSDPSVIATGRSINAVEGASTGSVLLATFTDPGGSAESLSDYSADIDWGDGTGTKVGAGVISRNGSTFEVRGSHTYAEESATDHPGSNPYLITITIHHEASTPTQVISRATVSDPAVVGTGGFTFNATEGASSNDQVVATFTDPGGPEPLGDYKAMIDWGDGTTPSVGTISVSGGTYTVKGSHTYAVGLGLPDDFGNTLCDAGTPVYHKAITVSLSHESAPLTTVTSTAAITIAPGTAHLAGGNLIVVGTTGDDQIVITPLGKSDGVRVALNSTDLGTFSLGAGGRIVVAAMDGDDNIQVAGGVKLPTVLYGGPGDDRIKGGLGPNILVGCEGDDDLTGGNAGDLLIGGDGSDKLNGGADDDILVAANLIDPATLSEDVVFSHLIAALDGGPIVADDVGDVDELQGASGTDQFYYHFIGTVAQDVVKGKAGIRFNA